MVLYRDITLTFQGIRTENQPPFAMVPQVSHVIQYVPTYSPSSAEFSKAWMSLFLSETFDVRKSENTIIVKYNIILYRDIIFTFHGIRHWEPTAPFA